MNRRPVAVALIAVFALYVAWLELAAAFILKPPRVAHDVWYGSAPLAIGVCLAVVVGVVVRRTVVLIIPFFAIAVDAAVNAAGVRPWHEVAPPINPGWPITISLAVAAGVGLVAALGGEAMRRPARARALY